MVEVCAEHGVPVVAFGAGTSLEGHVAAVARRRLASTSRRWTEVLAVHAGRSRRHRRRPASPASSSTPHLRDTGLFFPIDPGADATLGGMAATRASGTNAVRYGTMKENVLGLTVVLADGQVIRTGGRARKSSAGYDLTRLFVGSEGTLGIITEITVKLYGVPEAISAAVCSFPSVDDAVQAVIATIQAGIPVARIELLDELQMQRLHRLLQARGLPGGADAVLRVPRQRRPGCRSRRSRPPRSPRSCDGQDFQWATRPEDRNRLWQARHDSYYAALSLRPGCVGWATDVCVPISRLADCIGEPRARTSPQSGLLAPIVGHVGDGNFHLLMLLDPAQPEEIRQGRGAQQAPGPPRHRHGRHLHRRARRRPRQDGQLAEEAGAAVAVMAALKRTLDPQNILNPGKIVRL